CVTPIVGGDVGKIAECVANQDKKAAAICLLGDKPEARQALQMYNWNMPPSVGRAKGGEVPQLHRPLFSLPHDPEKWKPAFRTDHARAKSRIRSRSSCMCKAAAPW